MSLRHMKENHNIEDEKWAQLAKSIYEPEQLPTGEEFTSVEIELPVDAKEEEQLLLMAKKVDLYFQLKKYPAEPAFEKVQQQIRHNAQRKSTRVRKLIANPLMRIAAAILVTALLSVAGYDIVSNWGASRQMVELSASNQAVRTYTLPDGTIVSLNSNTLLRYPKEFGENTREVTIEGEAFFDVSPNKEKPFIIHAGNAQIKVLGTSFNVSAYPNETMMEVIVKTGRVQVLNNPTIAKQSDELILHPGDRGTLMYSSNALQKTINQDPNFLAWKTHDLIFRATSLGEVISNLEDVYKVTIRLEDPTLNGLLLTAHFNNYSLDFILEVIETTFMMETQRMNGQYILKLKS